MFRTQFNEIEQFEVVKITNKQVVYIDERGKERHEYKESDWRNWHESKVKALEFLVSSKENEIKKCEERIERYFGVNSLIFHMLGTDLIKHNVLLFCCTRRRWGMLSHFYDFTEEENTLRLKARKRRQVKRLRALRGDS